jgi:hypothetical protein
MMSTFARSARRPLTWAQVAAGLLLVGWACVSLRAAAQTGPQACGNPFRNHFGPYDFRTAPAETRKLVEDYHFTPGVETMTRPKNTMRSDMAQDVAYTLKVFPNHHRALVTMVRLAQRERRDPPPGTDITIECWFDRAVRFRPDDTVARSLYAQFLARSNRKADAERQLRFAQGHATDNALSHYNIGLVAMEAGLHQLALEQAHRALALGLPRQELADQLRRAQAWVEPGSANAPATPSTSASAAAPPSPSTSAVQP